MIGTSVYIAACSLFMAGGIIRLFEGQYQAATVGLLAGTLNGVVLLWR